MRQPSLAPMSSAGLPSSTPSKKRKSSPPCAAPRLISSISPLCYETPALALISPPTRASSSATGPISTRFVSHIAQDVPPCLYMCRQLPQSHWKSKFALSPRSWMPLRVCTDHFSPRIGNIIIQNNSSKQHSRLCTLYDYSNIFVTTPAPTVRPPSRTANRSPSTIATLLSSSAWHVTLSPGITISTPSGSITFPVISAVRM